MYLDLSCAISFRKILPVGAFFLFGERGLFLLQLASMVCIEDYLGSPRGLVVCKEGLPRESRVCKED